MTPEKCSYKGGDQCSNRRVYAFPGGEPQFCRKHRQQGMTNTMRQCEAPGCMAPRTFGMGKGRARFCTRHKLPGMMLTKRGYKADGAAGGNLMQGSKGAFKAKLGYDDFSDSASVGSRSVAGAGGIDTKRCGPLASHVRGAGLDDQPSVAVGYVSRPGTTAGPEGYIRDAVSEVSGVAPGIAVNGYENDSVGGPQSSPRKLEHEAGPSSASTVRSTSHNEQQGSSGQWFQDAGAEASAEPQPLPQSEAFRGQYPPLGPEPERLGKVDSTGEPIKGHYILHSIEVDGRRWPFYTFVPDVLTLMKLPCSEMNLLEKPSGHGGEDAGGQDPLACEGVSSSLTSPRIPCGEERQSGDGKGETGRPEPSSLSSAPDEEQTDQSRVPGGKYTGNSQSAKRERGVPPGVPRAGNAAADCADGAAVEESVVTTPQLFDYGPVPLSGAQGLMPSGSPPLSSNMPVWRPGFPQLYLTGRREVPVPVNDAETAFGRDGGVPSGRAKGARLDADGLHGLRQETEVLGNRDRHRCHQAFPPSSRGRSSGERGGDSRRDPCSVSPRRWRGRGGGGGGAGGGGNFPSKVRTLSPASNGGSAMPRGEGVFRANRPPTRRSAWRGGVEGDTGDGSDVLPLPEDGTPGWAYPEYYSPQLPHFGNPGCWNHGGMPGNWIPNPVPVGYEWLRSPAAAMGNPFFGLDCHHEGRVVGGEKAVGGDRGQGADDFGCGSSAATIRAKNDVGGDGAGGADNAACEEKGIGRVGTVGGNKAVIAERGDFSGEGAVGRDGGVVPDDKAVQREGAAVGDAAAHADGGSSGDGRVREDHPARSDSVGGDSGDSGVKGNNVSDGESGDKNAGGRDRGFAGEVMVTVGGFNADGGDNVIGAYNQTDGDNAASEERTGNGDTLTKWGTDTDGDDLAVRGKDAFGNHGVEPGRGQDDGDGTAAGDKAFCEYHGVHGGDKAASNTNAAAGGNNAIAIDNILSGDDGVGGASCVGGDIAGCGGSETLSGGHNTISGGSALVGDTAVGGRHAKNGGRALREGSAAGGKVVACKRKIVCREKYLLGDSRIITEGNGVRLGWGLEEEEEEEKAVGGKTHRAEDGAACSVKHVYSDGGIGGAGDVYGDSGMGSRSGEDCANGLGEDDDDIGGVRGAMGDRAGGGDRIIGSRNDAVGEDHTVCGAVAFGGSRDVGGDFLVGRDRSASEDSGVGSGRGQNGLDDRPLKPRTYAEAVLCGIEHESLGDSEESLSDRSGPGDGDSRDGMMTTPEVLITYYDCSPEHKA